MTWRNSDRYSVEPGEPATMSGREIRVLVRERDGDFCWICGWLVEEDLEQNDPAQASVDHVVERANGGGNYLSNLRLAHKACNYNRSNPHTPTWVPHFGRTPALERLIAVVYAMVEGRR